ncbi:hypothetical protein JCM13664_03570 [Methylothermus subterraneus]|nr:hypothetical protein HGMM_F07C12C11 [uncultured Gammaproteobacteria bacterium]BAL55735.1 hypothetical protein HGMM_F31D07C09 [uncultured Gammaproteobacteria bacterium]
MTQPPGLPEELRRWFKRRLKQERASLGVELSYEGNTPYDLLFYRLVQEAASHWQRRYGFSPTPEQLSRAFFEAEFERFRAGHPPFFRRLRKLKRWLEFFWLSLRGR